MRNPIVRSFFDRATGSLQYVFHCPATLRGAVVDPVWNYDPRAVAVWTDSADEIEAYVRDSGITLDWILDTHPHADHFSAAPILSERFGGVPRAIGDQVPRIQRLWQEIYGWTEDETPGPEVWDRLFAAGDRFMVGEVPVRVLFSPGHTLASVSYVAGDAAFVHDTLMKPASGTSRADFPGGDAGQLWDSIQEILALPPETRLYVGHDYPAKDADPEPMATVAAHRAANAHVKEGTARADFVARREARDATLPLPERMIAALQVNLRGGRLPPAGPDGRSRLVFPVNRFAPHRTGR
ncbi:MBL fold metallo-hydrolase [Frigidibacter oleivorans]|uniref:MBL fold metallo-hydrolase n=1 Tax=Frigidibacter oleivorans TaxID=2487129 RepID=UPI000F8DE8FF|nr:MBL fold metallo-hydrolase [Frigidibacter oleivorans]